ncbi:hypothetical protein [Nocardia sp. alder85J]|uniref:hypothetical protein n=1 Tax=Nocardia sp. alder85J TaxID=2862949 RepID=UPI001CD1984A|nr:hypothetical protein [Nocardia sp. alder85J]MCX4095535.1 hypothetical protein [Nocardia sp. alder85J]
MNTDITCTGTAGAAAAGAPVVRRPDPSPLEHWWTEVMDGALLPTPATGCPDRTREC